MQDFQAARLKALVQHAYQNVPYYRSAFDRAGLKPEQIRTLADLERIPFTYRTTLQSLPVSDVVARGYKASSLVQHSTSGSSGQPLTIRRSPFEEMLLQVYRMKVVFGLGMRPTDVRAIVVATEPGKPPWYVKTGLFRFEEIDCRWTPEQIVARLREIRPDVVRGYPGTLAIAADLMTDADREFIRPRLITTDSETLTKDARARISRAFRAPVFDFYDSHEFNVIAWECPSTGLYHTLDSAVIVEVIRNGRAAEPGEEGELVGTALHSWAMPFIRYPLGDLVTRGPDRCPCGAPGPVLSAIRGRVVDRFEFPNGRSLHPYVLGKSLIEHTWVRQFQIAHESVKRVRVKLAPKAGQSPNTETLTEIRHDLMRKLGAEISVDIELVDVIAPAPSGKMRPYLTFRGER